VNSVLLRLAPVLAGAITMSVVGDVPAGGGMQTFPFASFGTVTVYSPAAASRHVVLFLSGDGGWNLGVVGMADRLRDEGALVVGIDTRAFTKSLDSSAACAYPAGPLEELAREVELRFKFPRYERPILVGYSSGATLAYAAIAAAPPETFAGAISLGFCPDIEFRTPLCPMRGLKATRRPQGPGFDLAPSRESTVPWIVLQGEADQVCDPKQTRAFVAATGSAQLFSLPSVGHGFGVAANWERQFVRAYQVIAEAQRTSAPPPAPAAVADLPLIEVASAAGEDKDVFAVLLTGDGGWADIDKSVAAGLAARGIPVVGWNSLDYYWAARTPEGAASDLQRVIDYYSRQWSRSRILVVGYSFGADVASFLVNRLPDSVKARVNGVALLGPSAYATFAFHVTSWLGLDHDTQYPTAPEIARITVPVTCVLPTDDTDSVCHHIKSSQVRVLTVGTGHHFSGEYRHIVDDLLPR
jgi:type IV secretory pathway VirJ component